MIRTEKRLRLCTVLLVCCLIFIWGNSLLPGEISGAISDSIRKILEILFQKTETSPQKESLLLRKMAHFTEFAALGACLAWLFGMLGKRKLFPFLCGAAAACVDESIQLFIPDRGPSLRDVGIDTCGVLTGLILLYFGHYLIGKRKTTQHLEET